MGSMNTQKSRSVTVPIALATGPQNSSKSPCRLTPGTLERSQTRRRLAGGTAGWRWQKARAGADRGSQEAACRQRAGNSPERLGPAAGRCSRRQMDGRNGTAPEACRPRLEQLDRGSASSSCRD
ncbi:hypothetical protein AAFF_G00317980 [Aldrovandia affinis]|uniref:Uncharacterized protein n=1 Tax=Aldrovandia affinis TaxID=143900 RepID=A0AAD7W0T5_9TELE|nr:hypothetical protein AAFF_G00317980 [Aldrovandia affinis]